MKLTNNYDLPQPLVDAVRAYDEDYAASDPRRADFSVTTLLQPPQIVALKRQYGEQLTEDASDRIWALMGHAIHQILERADSTGLTENRLYIERHGYVISGQYDRMAVERGALQDYKICSVWEHISGIKPEREQQLNLLAHLARENGHRIEHLEIVAIYRDWSRTKAMTEENYPKSQTRVIPVRVWSPYRCEEFLTERLQLHSEAAKGRVMPCSPEDQWARPTKWAVMKKGSKRALKLHDLRETAEAHAEKAGREFYVQHRPGEKVRCNGYCPVSAFCPQRLSEAL